MRFCIAALLMLTVLPVIAAEPVAFSATQCEGRYRHHLQGVCTDGAAAIFWSFTTALVKTDVRGKVVKEVPVANHHGDLCFHDGKVYVAVNLGAFNRPAGQAKSSVYVYDAGTLREIARYPTPELVHGAGGIAFHEGRFVVVGGLPEGVEENYAYEYDEKFEFQKRHVLRSGYTLMGIQTAAFAEGHWWFGCYGNPRVLLKANPEFEVVGRSNFDAALGITDRPRGGLLVARGACQKEIGCTGRIVPAIIDEQHGLRIEKDDSPKSR